MLDIVFVLELQTSTHISEGCRVSTDIQRRRFLVLFLRVSYLCVYVFICSCWFLNWLRAVKLDVNKPNRSKKRLIQTCISQVQTNVESGQISPGHDESKTVFDCISISCSLFHKRSASSNTYLPETIPLN